MSFKIFKIQDNGFCHFKSKKIYKKKPGTGHTKWIKYCSVSRTDWLFRFIKPQYIAQSYFVFPVPVFLTLKVTFYESPRTTGSAKNILFCSTEELKSLTSRIAWGWANYQQMFIFWWTIPLIIERSETENFIKSLDLRKNNLWAI